LAQGQKKELEVLVFKEIRSQLETKLEAMQDKPMQIIEEARQKSQLESLGRPYINAVQIKVL
jgi:hypothetical protein